MIMAIFEPRLTGNVSASPLSGIAVTLIDRMEVEVVQAEQALEEGKTRSLNELVDQRIEVLGQEVKGNWMPTETLQLTSSALGKLKALSEDARSVVVNAILDISADPFVAAETAFRVQGDFRTEPLMTSVPGYPFSIIWTIKQGDLTGAGGRAQELR